jgi:hypothetical protein
MACLLLEQADNSVDGEAEKWLLTVKAVGRSRVVR